MSVKNLFWSFAPSIACQSNYHIYKLGLDHAIAGVKQPAMGPGGWQRGAPLKP